MDNNGAIFATRVDGQRLTGADIKSGAIYSGTIQQVSRITLPMPWYRRALILARAIFRGYIDLNEVQRG